MREHGVLYTYQQDTRFEQDRRLSGENPSRKPNTHLYTIRNDPYSANLIPGSRKLPQTQLLVARCKVTACRTD
jgi:hypothetical protein